MLKWLKKWKTETVLVIIIIGLSYVALCCGCISADTKAGIGVKDTTKPVDAGKDAKADDQDAQGAGNQQAADQVNSGGDTSKASSQQSGFFNFSVTDAIGTAGVGFGGSVAAWLLFAGFTRASDNKTERFESEQQTVRIKTQGDQWQLSFAQVLDHSEECIKAVTQSHDKTVHIIGEVCKAIAARGAN